MQNSITNFLRPGKTRFDNHESTVLVFSDQHHGGQEPIGWIAEISVPATLGVKQAIEHRLNVVKAA